MTQASPEPARRELGMIGLGVMGRNLLLNFAEHGFPVAGYDQDPAKVEALRGPIGLELGAETPEELAVAIAGELIAARRKAPLLEATHGARKALRQAP